MAHRVNIQQADRSIEVGDEETILEAALAAGIDYPFGCQSGNCGSCKSRLLAGEVELTEYSEFALTDEERDRGEILACSSLPLADCQVAWLELDETVQHPLRELSCRVGALERATHDITVVCLSVEDGGPFSFSAGQYAALSFGDLPPRDFSMANRTDQADLEFHIRAIDGGVVSPFVHAELRVGDKVRLSGPMGLAYLRDLHTGPIAAAAGGSGLAPIKSIVETALAMGMLQPISLYFGARDEADLYLVEHFQDLARRHDNLTFQPVLSEASGPTERRQGMLADVMAEDLNDLDGCKVYAAGPPPMVEAVRALAGRLGLREGDLHADPFYMAHELADGDRSA